MTGRARAAFHESAAAVRDILGSPGIRRIEAAWACGIAGDAAFLVGLLVVAFAAGGPLAVGLVGAARSAPAIVSGTLAGAVAGRLPPGQLLLAVHLGRAVPAIMAALIVILGGPLAIIVLLAAVSAGAGTLVRPLQASVMPSFARRPDVLVAANVALSTGEGLGASGRSPRAPGLRSPDPSGRSVRLPCCSAQASPASSVSARPQTSGRSSRLSRFPPGARARRCGALLR